MEQPHEWDELDDLIRQVSRQDGLEQPATGFTDRVMHAVADEKRPLPAFRPLIPGSILVVTFLVLFSGLSFLSSRGYFTNDSGSATYRFLRSIQLPRLHFEVPEMVFYMIGSALIMLMIQAFLLGGFFRKLYK